MVVAGRWSGARIGGRKQWRRRLGATLGDQAHGSRTQRRRGDSGARGGTAAGGGTGVTVVIAAGPELGGLLELVVELERAAGRRLERNHGVERQREQQAQQEATPDHEVILSLSRSRSCERRRAGQAPIAATPTPTSSEIGRASRSAVMPSVVATPGSCIAISAPT